MAATSPCEGQPSDLELPIFNQRYTIMPKDHTVVIRTNDIIHTTLLC